MSITAMPVMAAIIRDRGLSGSIAAVTATAAASLMDVGAWLVLALVLLGNAAATGRPWLLTLALTCGFALFMPLVVRPALRWWLDRPRQVLSSPLPVALALALASATLFRHNRPVSKYLGYRRYGAYRAGADLLDRHPR